MVHLAEEAEPANIKRLLFTLGALIRGHGAAARDFVESAGLTLLEHLFDHADATADVRRRCLTLVTDLITDARLHGTEGILEAVDARRWCRPLATVLADPHPASIDKALQATDSAMAVVKKSFGKD